MPRTQLIEFAFMLTAPMQCKLPSSPILAQHNVTARLPTLVLRALPVKKLLGIRDISVGLFIDIRIGLAPCFRLCLSMHSVRHGPLIVAVSGFISFLAC